MRNNLKIGLALGSGGGRGLSHIGVLEVFEREGFIPDFISGCSMGAITASVFAAGIPIDEMKKLALKMRLYQLADIGNVFTSMGIAKGDRSLNLIKKLIGDRNFDDCKIPIAISSTDLVKNEHITFRSGPLWRAVRASYAIPGLFEPVVIGKRVLVDGGLKERIPIKACRDMGADVVVAVDVLGEVKEDREFNKSITSIIERAYLIFDSDVNYAKIKKEADYLISPNIGSRSILNFANSEQTIEAGRVAAEEALPKIYEMMDNWEK